MVQDFCLVTVYVFHEVKTTEFQQLINKDPNRTGDIPGQDLCNKFAFMPQYKLDRYYVLHFSDICQYCQLSPQKQYLLDEMEKRPGANFARLKRDLECCKFKQSSHKKLRYLHLTYTTY